MEFIEEENELTRRAIYDLSEFILYKPMVWEYENELRLSIPSTKEQPLFFSEGSIKSVTFGEKLGPDIKDRFVKTLRSKGVERFYEARVKRYEYQIELSVL